MKVDNFMYTFESFSKWHTMVNAVAQIQQLVNRNKSAKAINVKERWKASLVLTKLAQK